MSQEGTAFPTPLITAQGCPSGNSVSLPTGGFVQHQREISDQTPTVRALQEPAATSGCRVIAVLPFHVPRDTEILATDRRSQDKRSHKSGLHKKPVSRARLLQQTYSSQHLLCWDKGAVNAPFKFWP